MGGGSTRAVYGAERAGWANPRQVEGSMVVDNVSRWWRRRLVINWACMWLAYVHMGWNSLLFIGS